MDNIVNNLHLNITKLSGDKGLIIEAKSIQFNKDKKSSEDEIDTALNVLSLLDYHSQINETQKIKLQSVLTYLAGEIDQKKAIGYVSRFDPSLFNKNLRSTVNTETLHLVYNLIEFEDKFQTMNLEKLKNLQMQLITYDKTGKNFVEYILYKYYTAVLNNLLGELLNGSNMTLEVMAEISDVDEKEKTQLIEYIELKNHLLYIKILKSLKQDKDQIDNLQSIIDNYQSKGKIALLVTLQLRIFDLLIQENNYERAYKLLIQTYKQLKHDLLLKYNIYQNSSELLLNLITKLIGCSIILGAHSDTAKYQKKLEKHLNMLQDYVTNDFNDKLVRDNILVEFRLHLLTFNYISKSGHIDKNTIYKAITDYKVAKGNTKIPEETIINIFALNNNDSLSKYFFELLNRNTLLLTNDLNPNTNYISLFTSIFIRLSELSKSLLSDSNATKQAQYLNDMRYLAKAFINFVTVNFTAKNNNLILLPYFKEILIKVYYNYAYTFYYSNQMKTAISILDEFDSLAVRLELNHPASLVHYAMIVNLKGDISFKQQAYEESCSNYLKVRQIYDDTNLNTHHRALNYFNLGLVYLYLRETSLSKEHLTLSLNKYEILNKIYPGSCSSKVSEISVLLTQISF